MRVAFSKPALRKLQSIDRWYRPRNHVAGLRIVGEIIAFCTSLDHMPYRFPVVEIAGRRVRKGQIGRYRVFYEVDGRMVFILAIIHDHQDLRRLRF